MRKILMSINPEHVDNILAGTKRFEFRKTKCKESINAIVIYSTAPVMQVVAEVEVTQVIEGSPQSVWNKTAYAAGIDKGFFDEYYSGKNHAVAYMLGHISKFQNPLPLSSFGIKTPPQSYVYVQ